MRSRHSRNVCTACRSRKVRCDGRVGGCENCSRLAYRCSLAVHSEERPTSGNEVFPRKRARLACQPCKSQKARCTGESPSCQRCRRKDIPCTYVPSQRSINSERLPQPDSSSDRSPQPSPTTRSSAGLSNTVVRAHVHAFFRDLNPLPTYSFLHKAVFLQMWQSGQVDSALLKAVCGSIAHAIEDPRLASDEQALNWIEEARHELMEAIETPTLARVQALQLIVLHSFATQQYRRLLILSSLCVRSAFLLRLNQEAPRLPPLTRELRRRLMWSIYVADTFLSGGLPSLTLCSASNIHLHLPCEEPNFALDQVDDTEPLHPTTSSSPAAFLDLLAYYIRTINIRDRILRYTKGVVKDETNTPQLTSQMKTFEQELGRLKDSLPSTMVLTPKNLSLRSCSTDTFPRFVLLHVWWHQCQCDLFRIMIPACRESLSDDSLDRIPSELLQHYQSQCISHAHRLAEIFQLLLNLDLERPIPDPGLAVPAYQCANILSHSRSMHQISSTEDVGQGLRACLHLTEGLVRPGNLASVVVQDIRRLVESRVAADANSQRHFTHDRAVTTPGRGTSGNDGQTPYSFAESNGVVAAAGYNDEEPEIDLTPASRQQEQQHPAPQQSVPVTGDLPQGIDGPQAIYNLHLTEQDSADVDWFWSIPTAKEVDSNFDTLFDPLWQLHNQWDTL